MQHVFQNCVPICLPRLNSVCKSLLNTAQFPVAGRPGKEVGESGRKALISFVAGIPETQALRSGWVGWET